MAALDFACLESSHQALCTYRDGTGAEEQDGGVNLACLASKLFDNYFEYCTPTVGGFAMGSLMNGICKAIASKTGFSTSSELMNFAASWLA